MSKRSVKSLLFLKEEIKDIIIIKGWKVQQVVFVSGTCGFIHVESFNRNMKALGGSLRASGTLFARNSRGAYLRNRTRCYGPISHNKRGGRGAMGGVGATARAGNMSAWVCMCEEGARGPWPSDRIWIK